MKLFCTEFSHYTTPVHIRERLACPTETVGALYDAFWTHTSSLELGIEELVIVSTCNRVEFYAAIADGATPSILPATLANFISSYKQIPLEDLMPLMRVHWDETAVSHACRVAAGLESQVLGEPQILGQMASAVEQATRHKACGPMLKQLFKTAVRVGKRARTETAISREAVSVSSVASQLARQQIGPLADKQVTLVGVGEMGRLALKALRAEGVVKPLVVNRTLKTAVLLANQFGGEARPLTDLTAAIAQSDVVLTATGATQPILDKAGLVDVVAEREEKRPLLIIDLAVPRNVAADVAELDGVTLFDMDDLVSRQDASLQRRQAELPKVEAIIAAEKQRCLAAFETLAVTPTISDLYQQGETIRQRELARFLRKAPDMDPELLAQVQLFSQSLVKKLLHQPTQQLRKAAASGAGATTSDAIRDLFQLPNAAPLSLLNEDKNGTQQTRNVRMCQSEVFQEA
ncbi:MAG: glutamyl-tRNA reductase [Chloroflexota bacterium]